MSTQIKKLRKYGRLRIKSPDKATPSGFQSAIDAWLTKMCSDISSEAHRKEIVKGGANRVELVVKLQSWFCAHNMTEVLTLFQLVRRAMYASGFFRGRIMPRTGIR